MGNQNSNNSWKSNRDLLRIQEQERRRRLVAPQENDLFLRKTPLFAKPYKTNKEDELSRRVKKLLGDWEPKVPPRYESPLNPIWIPKKPKSNSQAPSHRPASSKTNPYEDIWKEYSPESLDIAPNPEQNYGNSNEGLSNRRSEARAPQSEILPELVKKKKPIDVSSTEKTLKVVEKPTSSLGPPRVLQSQPKRVAPAQPSSSESGSPRDCHSSSVSALPRAPAPEPTAHIYLQPIEGILKDMTSPLSPLLPFLQSPVRTESYEFPLLAKEMSSSPPAVLSHLQLPTRAETSKLPLATKESHPGGSAAQKQKQANTASETLPSSQPRTLVLQSQPKRVAPAQPSSSESGSPRDCHSSSVSALPRAPAPEPTAHIYLQPIEGILKDLSSPLSPLLPFLQSPVRTETYEFPLLAEAKPSDGPLTEEILREMSSSPPAVLSHLQSPTRAETSKLPLATKESHPGGSAAQKQKQAKTASETLPSSQPRTLVLQSQPKRVAPAQPRRVAPAQPSSSESGSPRDCHSSSVCDSEISSSDTEDSLPRVLDLPVCEPEPSSAQKWRLDNLVTQTKQGAVPREGLREIARGNGHEEGVKQEHGISSSSCRQHSEAREPPHESCGQVATDFHKTFAQVPKTPQESHVRSTHSSLKPFEHTKEALWVSKIVGIKRPSKPLVHDKSRKVLKLESEPGPLEVRDHSSKDKLKVQEAENTKRAFGNGLKLGMQKHFEKWQHKAPDKSCAHVPKAPDQSCSQVAKAPHESDVTPKHSFLEPPVHTKEALLKNTLGIKRPSMSWVHDESKRVWKAEREPGLLQVTDQSCKDQPDVKKIMKPTLQKPSEKRKDKGSHQANTKGFLEPRLLRPAQEWDALIPSGHRPEDLHKEKVPLPPGDKKLFSPARDTDLKRKAMRSPEESPGKKKREDKGNTPRKKKE